MDLTRRESGEHLLFTMSGEVVHSDCDAFRTDIIQYVADRDVETVCLDMSDVTLIDSVGLGFLMGVKMTVTKKGARLAVLAPSQAVMGTFRMTKFDKVFEIFDRQGADALCDLLELNSEA